MATPVIKAHDSDEPASTLSNVSCRICRRQISRYTCPSCNLPYCSLNCFRSEVRFQAPILPTPDENPKKPHSRCSETFYRKELEVGIKLGSSGAKDDRNNVIELLKRIEDQSAADEDGPFHLSDHDDEVDIAHRFSAIDMSSASADDLLRLLTTEQRDKFFVALKDPSSGLVQELLASAEFGETRQLPWWEAPSDVGQSPLSLRALYGIKPDLMVVPTNLINQASRGISLLYNICAVLLAYTYVTRHLSISPLASTTNHSQDQHEARRILSQSLPFLTDRKSKLQHISLTDAVITFWSQFDPGSIDSRAMLVLLEDVAKLVRPRRITITEHSSEEQERTVALATDHPFAMTVMVISDMSSLFDTAVDPSAVASRGSHIVMKLTFYAAHILSTPPPSLHALADEIILFSKSMAMEAQQSRFGRSK